MWSCGNRICFIVKSVLYGELYSLCKCHQTPKWKCMTFRNTPDVRLLQHRVSATQWLGLLPFLFYQNVVTFLYHLCWPVEMRIADHRRDTQSPGSHWLADWETSRWTEYSEPRTGAPELGSIWPIAWKKRWKIFSSYFSLKKKGPLKKIVPISIKAEPFMRIWQSLSWSRNAPPIMTPGGLLSYSQALATDCTLI